MSDREGHGHRAVLYKSHFPPLRDSEHSFSQRHRCIHRLINHVYYKGQALCYSFAPTTGIKNVTFNYTLTKVMSVQRLERFVTIMWGSKL